MSSHTRRNDGHQRSRDRKVATEEEEGPPHQQSGAALDDIEYTSPHLAIECDPSVYQNIDEEALMEEVFQTPGYGYDFGSQKANAAITTSGSLLNTSVGSSIVMTGSGSGSFVQVLKRTHSDASNRTSAASSDARQFSVPDDAEWNHVVEERPETVENNLVPDMLDRNYILANLYNCEPRTVHVPYQTYMTSSDDDCQYHDHSQYTFGTGTPSANFLAFPSLLHDQKTTSDPWNSIHYQVPKYPTGFVAFAPSPVASLDCVSRAHESASPGTCSSMGSPRSGTSYDILPHPRRALARDKGKHVHLGWEHLTVFKGGLEHISDHTTVVPHRIGIRKGKLDPATKEKACRIRRLKACWNCWIQKVPCSEGKTCDTCKRQFSPSAGQLCSRAGFRDYVEIFFPEFLHSHLRKHNVEDLVTEHTSYFTNMSFDVEVSSGSVFIPLIIHVNLFEPKTTELIQHARLEPSVNHNLQLFNTYSAPVGILGLETGEMEELCNTHIENMIVNPQYAAQTTAGETSQLPRALLQVIIRYVASKDMPLLRNTLKLHAIHHFMKSLITFSASSATLISTQIHNHNRFSPSSQQAPQTNTTLSSRLLNRQLKHTMHILHRRLTTLVLSLLEKSLRTRTKDAWAPSFCAILLLCLCVEKLQIAARTMALYSEAGGWERQSGDACVSLDDLVIGTCGRLFHDVYRSRKRGGEGAREGGFNPLKAVRDRGETGLDGDGDWMVRGVLGVIDKFDAEIIELAEMQHLPDAHGIIEPQDIKDSSNGRLAAKFLSSFFTVER